MNRARYFIGRRGPQGFPLYRIMRIEGTKRDRYVPIDHFPTRAEAGSFATFLRNGGVEADALAERAQP